MFDQLEIEIDFLAEVSDRSNIEARTSSTDGRNNDRIEVEYEQPADVIAVLPTETVRLHSALTSGRSGVGHMELDETVRLIFETHDAVTLTDLVDRYVSRVRDLITFAAQRPAAVRSVRVAGPATIETLPSGREVKRSASFLAAFLPEPSAEPAPKLTRRLLRIPDEDRAFRSLLRCFRCR